MWKLLDTRAAHRNLGWQPPHDHTGHVEFVKLDECCQSVRAEGIRQLGRAGGIGADVLPSGRQDIDRPVASRLLLPCAAPRYGRPM